MAPRRPRPLELIAHRGTPREYPENSLPGFARALELGADAVELDVHLTADGVPVVHHDAELAGGSLGGRAIAGLTRAELAAAELAPGVTLPTLAEVCAAVGDRATVYVEIKAPRAEAAVAAVLGGLGARAPVHSFDHRVSRRVHDLLPATPVGVLSTSYLVDTVSAMHAAGARDLWQHWSVVDAALVDVVHGAGGRVIVWTVNDADVARALADLGVDGICSDVPGVLRSAFGGGGS
jgi:glycerophosphoryl diester phosphodiesterase